MQYLFQFINMNINMKRRNVTNSLLFSRLDYHLKHLHEINEIINDVNGKPL